MDLIDELSFDEKGLIPAVIQDSGSSKVLTLCYMDKEALEKTFKEKKIYEIGRAHV